MNVSPPLTPSVQLWEYAYPYPIALRQFIVKQAVRLFCP